ncbi:MAG: archease [Actinomycetota bacterium]|jgi:SHS2 domain-containing protein|nr:archease [Actinomycetota bacterium]
MVIKKYTYIDHLSDVGIEFYGNTLEELFENAAAGMFSIMYDLKTVKPLLKKEVRISGKDINYEDLLILWLERLLYLHEVNTILFSDFKVKKIEKKENAFILEAEIYGEKIDLSRHEIEVAIKAPTYHDLEIKENGEGYRWRGRVIFDV